MRRRGQPDAAAERREGVDHPPVAPVPQQLVGQHLVAHQLDSFMADHYPSVVRTVAVACGDVGLAHDAVQDALARALDQQRRGRPIEHLPGWIVVVALNHLRSSFRRRGRETRALSRMTSSGTAPTTTVDDPILIDLQRAIVLLPMRQRQCVVLHHLQGYGVDELSVLLGISSGTVKSALFRGRDALRRSLTDRDVDDPPVSPTTQEAAS
jgi:RNA polymerase sigma-70 factor, ECF subfamily